MSVVHSSKYKKHAFRVPTLQDGTVFILALGSYFFLHFLIRINLSDSLDMDEAEAVFAFQHLRLGYGTQPPLYNWLQWLMFQAFGLNLFALSALKNALLMATYLSVFYLARPLTGTRGAMAASASLLLFPQIGWESQRDLTHSVLLTTLACATLWSYFTLLRKPVSARYALFGLLIGLGMQTKYNFAVFVAGLACASLLVKEHRQILWNRRMVMAAAVALLVVMPHGLWLLNNLEAAAGGTLRKMAEGTPHAGYLHSVATGMISVLTAALSFAALAIVVYGLAGGRRWRQAAIDWRSSHARFFIFLYASFFALLTCMVLTGEVGKIKDRWMQPLLFSLPVACFVVLPVLAQSAVYRRILAATAVVALVILAAMPLRIYLGPVFDKHVRPHYPYPELSTQLARSFPKVQTVVTDQVQIAGNLHFQLPAVRTLVLEDALKQPETLPQDVLVVTFGEDGKARSELLDRLRAAYPDSTILQEGRLDLRLRYGSKKSMPFDYAHLTLRKP
jgi:4-amino-4-deoxy-L-arabinose transferase-like glycosyltransferase